MLRRDFLDQLELASPALASNDLVPILTHFGFTGSEVLAYNDQIGMSLPLKTQFKGAVPGGTLIDLLRASKAKEVELAEKSSELEIKAASSRFKLPVMGKGQFVFEMPEPSGKVLPVNLGHFADAVEACLMSVISSDLSVPDYLGVTMIADGDALLLFSTNNATLSTSELPLTGKCPFKGRVILPALFCQQVLKLVGSFKGLKLEVNADYALLSVEGGVRCFGRFVNSPKPKDFIKMADAHLSGAAKKLRPIPSKMRLVAERACVITQSVVESTLTKITVRGGIMKFISQSSRGEVVDSVQVDQDDAELALDPKFLKDGLVAFYDSDEKKNGKMLMLDSCFILERGSSSYLIAATGKSGK
jgi:DNA polymerase III sliding clamp (beta) subunit (PCNA family)